MDWSEFYVNAPVPKDLTTWKNNLQKILIAKHLDNPNWKENTALNKIKFLKSTESN